MSFIGILGLIGGICVGLLILVILVVIHELGHAIAARRNGVVVEEFGIGFPPRAWSKKLKNGVLFSINWLPLGGFVKLQGENDAASKKGDYGAASMWAKTKILLAGVTINWIAAAVILTILAITGLPKVLDNQFQVPGDTTTITKPVTIGFVSHNSPAQKSGLRAKDELISINNQHVSSSEDLFQLTKKYSGQEVKVVYRHDGKQSSVKIHLNSSDKNNEGYLGVSSIQQVIQKSTWSAPIVGIGTTAQFTGVTLKGLGNLVVELAQGLTSKFSSNQATRSQGNKDLQAAGASVAGPIGILGIIFPAAVASAPTSLLLLTAIISLTLALINVLPIPALDGGRLFVTLIFKGLKKPLTKEKEEKIHGTGFAFLMILVLVVTVADVSKLFH